MNRFEESVIDYINANPYYFLNHQLNIAFDKNSGGTIPDMVVFDIRDKSIIVVEVSSASNISTLLNNYKQAEERWYAPLRTMYGSHIDPNKMFCALFIREVNIKKASDFLKKNNVKNVQIISLEKIQFGWKWDWKIQDDGMNYPLNSLVDKTDHSC